MQSGCHSWFAGQHAQRATFELAATNAAHFSIAITGQKELKIPFTSSQQLINVFDMMLNLVQSFASPGWFLHLAFMEDIKGRFDELHDAALGALSDAGATELPHGKHLMPGDYKEPCRALRR